MRCHTVWIVVAGSAALLGLGAGAAHGHPSLYFGASELPSLQARAVDTTVGAMGYDFAGVFDAMQSTADQYQSEPCSYTVQIPNSSGTGSETWSYTVSTALPPPHPNNPSYPPWTGLSRLIQRRLETLAFVYALTGDDSYLTNAEGFGALDLALDLAAWSQWTDPGYSCGGAASCLDTAHLTMGMALLYDLAFDAMSAAERTAIRDAIVQLGVTPLEADVSAANATSGGMAAWFNGYALRVTGLAVGACAVAEDVGAAADPWLAVADDSVRRFFTGQGSDGGAYEGQLYGAYATDQLVIGAHALALQGTGSDLFDDDWLRGIPRFAAAFLGSESRQQANFGDSSLAAYWGGTMFALAAHGDAAAQWYLELTGLAKPAGPIHFVWARQDLDPTPIADSGTALYADVGHAALRAGFDGAPVVAIKSGPPSVVVGHNHLDHNSFIVSAHGEWIASDPGYQSYFNPAEHHYTTGTVGHSTLMVDKTVAPGGESSSGGQVEPAGGSLEYLFDGAGYAKVVAKAAATYPAGLLSRFGRRIFYAKPDLVWVFDDVAAPAAHEYSFLLYASATSELAAGDGPGELLITGQTARLQAFVVATAPLVSGSPTSQSHPGAASYGPYGEWRTTSAAEARFAAALVPGRISHTALSNPGFEDDLISWQPRFQDGSHGIDTAEAHGGQQSARIDHPASTTGYFYSEPLTVLPGASVDAAVFVKAQGTGTVSIQPYWMSGGSYIADPAGDASSLDAATLADWTALAVSATVPASGVDAVRIALQYSGTGTVWFDDASFATSPSLEPTPLSEAVTLGDPPAGLVVAGPFGIEAAASLVGSAATGPHTLEPAWGAIEQVPSLSSDGQLFAVGLESSGAFRRAFLQGGTFVSVGTETMVRAASYASLDAAVTYDETGCASLRATEVPTVEGPPYGVRTAAREVYLNGQRVAFESVDGELVFPQGDDLGPGCPLTDPGTDGGTGGGAVTPPGAEAGPSDEDGCGCRAAGRGARSPVPRGWVLCASVLGLLRRRARRSGRNVNVCSRIANGQRRARRA